MTRGATGDCRREGDEAGRPALAPSTLPPMLLLLIMPLPLLGITPVTVSAGVEVETAALVAASIVKVGSAALPSLATDLETASAEEFVELFVVLSPGE